MFYTVGLNKTILIVGLGNPGKQYDMTRHNIGYNCVDKFVENFDELRGWTNKTDLKCLISTGQLSDKRVIIIKPTTYMNNSGEAVSLVSNFYKIEIGNVIVIHDDIDIDFGQIKIKLGGSSAGHNGIKSITNHLGDENYGRIRIGIGPKKPLKMDSKDFVLQKFSDEQISHLDDLTKEVAAVVTEFTYGSGVLDTQTRSFVDLTK